MRFGDSFDQIIKHAIKARLTPFLLGEPGIGKSAAVAAIADELGGRMFTVACNHLAEKADLTGVRTVPVTRDDEVVGYKQVFFPMEDVTDCVMWAKDHPREIAVLFLDELNRTSGDVTSALLSLQTARKIGTLTLPDNVFMICAGNDKGNVTSLDDASVSRFLLLRMEPDAGTWLRVNPEANSFVASALKKHPELVFCRERPAEGDGNESSDLDDILLDGSEMRQFTTPRTITYLSEWLNTFDSLDQLAELDIESAADKQSETAFEECVHAIVGSTAFADAVILEVREAMAAGVQEASNAFRVPRPPFMDDLYAATTRSEIDGIISSLSAEARSQAIVSAVCEHVDRRGVIDALANGLGSLTGNSLYTLMQASHAGLCDRDNLEHFKDATTAGETVAQFI